MTAIDVLDADAFTDLYAAELATLVGWLRQRIPAAAEDLAQETFARVWSARATYRPGAGSPRAWLYAIAGNVVVDHLRRAGCRPQTVGGLDLDVVDDVDVADAVVDRMAADEAGATVTAAIEQLPERERQVVQRRYLDEQPVAAVAAALGMPIGTVKSMAHRAMRALATILNAPTAQPAAEPRPAPPGPVAAPAPRPSPTPARSVDAVHRVGPRRHRRRDDRPPAITAPARGACAAAGGRRPRHPGLAGVVGLRPVDRPTAADAIPQPRVSAACRPQTRRRRRVPQPQRREGALTMPLVDYLPYLVPVVALGAGAALILRSARQDERAGRMAWSHLEMILSPFHTPYRASGRGSVQQVEESGGHFSRPEADDTARFPINLDELVWRMRTQDVDFEPGRHRVGAP